MFRSRSLYQTSLVALIAVLGCPKEQPKVEALPPKNVEAPPTTAVPTTTAEEGRERFVVKRSSLRRTPADAAKIPNPTGKGTISNFLTTLQRGETVRVLKEEGDWAQVKASDDSEGWIQIGGLLARKDITMVTVLEEVQTFNRPDMVAVGTSKLPPGELLYVVTRKGPFAEVNFSAQKTIWVLDNKLVAEDAEVQLARMIGQARSLMEAKNNEGATQLLGVAESQFKEAKLLAVLTAIIKGEAVAPTTAEPGDTPVPPAEEKAAEDKSAAPVPEPTPAPTEPAKEG